MRILYVIDSMTKDGAESQLLKTAARLSPAQYEVYVVLSRAVGEYADRLTACPAVREVIAIGRERKRMHIVEKAFSLAGIIRAIQPDVVHSWLWYSNFLCGLSRKLGFWRCIPFIASQRGDYQARYGSFRLWLTEKIIYNTADTLLTNSERIQRNLREQYPEKKIFAIPNLLELPTLELRKCGDKEEKLIVSVGRFAPEKGHRYLIEALKLLKQDDKELTWRCTFLGDGELKGELHNLTAQYKLTEQVTFPGFCEDVFSFLSMADVFVLPSLHESSPNALIEAMGIGLPCIASEVGGVTDLIEHEKNGVCVVPRNPTALAAALRHILSEPAIAIELGKNAQLTIKQKFNSADSLQKLEEIYHGFLR